MLDVVKMRVAQIVDIVRSTGWTSLIRKVVFLKRTAIVVEKDLAEVTQRPEPLTNSRLTLLEINQEILASRTYHFPIKQRYLKALNYIKHGNGGFAVVRDNTVVGDMWYYSLEATNDPRTLPADLRQLGFKTWPASSVFTFDIFVVPAERKNGVAAAFQNNAMLCLRSKGFTKAFGFYWADNILAHWCTRVTNKWKKIRAVNISRFLLFTKAVPAKE